MKFKIHLQLTDEELEALLWVLHTADINTMSHKPAAKRSALRKTIGALEKQQVYRAEFREFFAWRKAKAKQSKKETIRIKQVIDECKRVKYSSFDTTSDVIDVTQHNSPRPRWKKLPVYSTDPNKDK